MQSQGVFGLWSGFGGSLLFRSNFMWMFMGYEVLSCSLCVVCSQRQLTTKSPFFFFSADTHAKLRQSKGDPFRGQKYAGQKHPFSHLQHS